jgi:phosphoribosylglycinamide formyltransferase-1
MPAADPANVPKRPMRISVLLSGGGSTLENLLQRIGDGRLPGVEIVQVVSSRAGVRGVAIAEAAGLSPRVISPADHADSAAFSAALTAAVRAAAPDLVVMAGFLSFWQIPPDFEGRVVNIHPALLPAHGGKGLYGRRVHEAVLRSGDRWSGCTVHWADNQYDHGPPIAQARLEVLPNDTPDTLAARVGRLERELYPEVLRTLAQYVVRP